MVKWSPPSPPQEPKNSFCCTSRANHLHSHRRGGCWPWKVVHITASSHLIRYLSVHRTGASRHGTLCTPYKVSCRAPNGATSQPHPNADHAAACDTAPGFLQITIRSQVLVPVAPIPMQDRRYSRIFFQTKRMPATAGSNAIISLCLDWPWPRICDAGVSYACCHVVPCDAPPCCQPTQNWNAPQPSQLGLATLSHQY